MYGFQSEDEVVFGFKDPALDYKTRIGSYIIIPNQELSRMLLVTAPNGALLLPGGEMEADEDQFQTLKRELVEEAGFEVKDLSYLGRSSEYFYSHFRQQAYYNPGYFFAALGFEKIQDPLEDFNNLIWVPIAQGLRALKRPTHRWAVKNWLKTLA
ncbi:NUDIX hydrolase [Agrilactobacillus fermenti]|uniref:NUDIX hydrolase n=1 Tax=Agrilactobacillus fermenti TaxID=2586909 RepID=UPI001E287943|nr:NUDIX domain-containing protein [Agrilactobacillus fermenti]MCD2255973.1 NUDIX domain-containing protein [Agrilactobacillus fermenti]